MHILSTMPTQTWSPINICIACPHYWCACASLQPSYLRLGKNFSSSVLSCFIHRSNKSLSWPLVAYTTAHTRAPCTSAVKMLPATISFSSGNSEIFELIGLPGPPPSYCWLGVQKQRLFLWRCLCCTFCPILFISKVSLLDSSATWPFPWTSSW